VGTSTSAALTKMCADAEPAEAVEKNSAARVD